MTVKMMMLKIGVGVIVLRMLGSAVESAPNMNIIEWRCNANSYSQTDAYAGNVEYVIADLVAITPNTGYDHYSRSPSNTDVCYGYAYCGTTKTPLTSPDCSACLSAARDAIMDICSAKIGAMVWMVDCLIRYENYRF